MSSELNSLEWAMSRDVPYNRDLNGRIPVFLIVERA